MRCIWDCGINKKLMSGNIRTGGCETFLLESAGEDFRELPGTWAVEVVGVVDTEIKLQCFQAPVCRTTKKRSPSGTAIELVSEKLSINLSEIASNR